MQRFYFPTLDPSTTLTIHDEGFVHQVSRVLRSAPGDTVMLFSGDGWDYIYEIRTITKKDITLQLREKTKNEADPIHSIQLLQALPNKYEKIEYILQKWVEVGISEFVFFPSERSQKLAINERKNERFTDIAREALEQCGGNQMPEIRFLDTVPDLKTIKNTFILHTQSDESQSLSEASDSLKFTDPISILVGPEGGWNDREIEFFRSQWAQTIHFGNRILRTETAGIVTAFFFLQKN